MKNLYNKVLYFDIFHKKNLKTVYPDQREMKTISFKISVINIDDKLY